MEALQSEIAWLNMFLGFINFTYYVFWPLFKNIKVLTSKLIKYSRGLPQQFPIFTSTSSILVQYVFTLI
jgi:hypothetical protein